MFYCRLLAALVACLSLGATPQVALAADTSGDQIIAIAEKMICVIESMGDFSCDEEVQYYRLGKDDKLYRFTFFWGKAGITRIKLSRPYPGLTASYKKGESTVTVQPFPFPPFIKLAFSLEHSLVRSPSGQRMDQASVEYLSRFLYNNITSIKQRESSFSDEPATAAFTFWAEDYIDGKEINRYHGIASRDDWLPLRIERYNQINVAIEVLIFKKFTGSDSKKNH